MTIIPITRIVSRLKSPALARCIIATVAAIIIAGCGTQSLDGPSGQLPSAPIPSGLLPPSHLTMVSGDKQTVMVNYFPENPFRVRVTDEQGNGKRGVRIDWRFDTGSGLILTYPDHQFLSTGYSLTDSDGVSTVHLKPNASGANLVVATAPVIVGPSITFTTTVMPPVFAGPSPAIFEFGPLFDCTGADDPVFYTPAAATVLLGVPVEFLFSDWVYPSCKARIMSTSVPPGGSPFDSGNLAPGQRFRFVPNAPGTWEFIDVYSTGKGSFTVISP